MIVNYIGSQRPLRRLSMIPLNSLYSRVSRVSRGAFLAVVLAMLLFFGGDLILGHLLYIEMYKLKSYSRIPKVGVVYIKSCGLVVHSVIWNYGRWIIRDGGIPESPLAQLGMNRPIPVTGPQVAWISLGCGKAN